jgi:hypothetical protein
MLNNEICMLGDMATFIAPEQTAEWARPFFGE